MDLETIVLLATALGVGGITPKLAQALIDRVRNRDQEERDAWKRLDAEAHHRRVIQERFHRHRNLCQWSHRDRNGRPIEFSTMPPGPDDPL